MPTHPEARFDLERSRRYWRHAPSGAGKIDTGSLFSLDSVDHVWDAAFRSRVLNYPEEEQFIRSFADRVRGRRIVSIGSGLGFHELFYASAGARMACCDIVASNLAAIEAVAERKGLEVETCAADDVTSRPLPGPADIVFVYGCLMHMPPEAQRALLGRAREALAPGGSVVFMVYAWEFVRRTCGWNESSAFDPVAFARASDPTVGDEACPWSDWHDERKLLDLAGAGARMARRQSWNDGQFTWFELDWSSSQRPPVLFFQQAALRAGSRLLRLRRRDFTASEATVARGWRSVTVRMPPSLGHYALLSPIVAAPAGANAVVVDISLEQGAVSVGVLDVDAERFVATAVRTEHGRHSVLLLAEPMPPRFRVVISNYQTVTAAPGAFVLYDVQVLHRPIAAVPRDRAPQR
jgi:SAM-dependent methyltransferase